AGVVARHLNRLAAECSLGGEHGFDCSTLNFLSLTCEGLRIRLGTGGQERAGNDECCATDHGGHGNKIRGLVELFQPVTQPLIKLSRADERGLCAEPADSALAFKRLEPVMLAIPMVDLCEQPILHLRSGPCGLGIETSLDLVHA